jgi:hypothetical protein
MKEYNPPRPVGNDRESQFMQWVYDKLTRPIISGKNTKVTSTQYGLRIEANSKTESTTGDSGVWL